MALTSLDANNYRSRVIEPKPHPTPGHPQRVTSETLLGPRRELVIVHNGREYKLRLTQNGKLILTA